MRGASGACPHERCPLSWDDGSVWRFRRRVRKGTCHVRSLHSLTRTHASFDDPDLVSHPGLVPVMALAQRPGLAGLVAARLAAVEDVHPRCGRELCALARVNMNGTREPSRWFCGDSPRWQCGHQPTRWRFSGRVKACRGLPALIVVDPQAGSVFTAPGPVPGTFRARPRDCAAHCRGHCVPAFWRRSLWFDQGSARRALAGALRGSSEASTTAAMSSRCSPEPSARSRRLPDAAG